MQYKLFIGVGILFKNGIKRWLSTGANSMSMLLFLVLISVAALGNGLSDSVFGNYFKEAYGVTASQRAFIEFPRELPGLLCALVIAGLSFLGDLRIALIAQIAACVGITALGLFTPSFGIMLVFLFLNSMGMHIFMPLQDSIGMQLAEPNRVGQRMGEYASLKTAVGFVTAILVFFGFRFGWFSFNSQGKLIFIISGMCFAVAAAVNIMLIRQAKRDNVLQLREKRKFKLIFRYKYRFYYLLTILHGVQKQIAYVFGSWVVIDLLLKGADIMSLLTIVSSFIGIFFLKKIGGWVDRLGIRLMMYVDALSFIVVYVLYGFVVWGIAENAIPSSGWPVIVVYALFVLDRLSMQVGIVKSVYLKSIAENTEEITAVLSTGISLDHVVAILAAQLSGFIWTAFGPQWVFFMAAFFSLGNLFVASKIEKPHKDKA